MQVEIRHHKRLCPCRRHTLQVPQERRLADPSWVHDLTILPSSDVCAQGPLRSLAVEEGLGSGDTCPPHKGIGRRFQRVKPLDEAVELDLLRHTLETKTVDEDHFRLPWMQFRFHLLREVHLAWRAFCADACRTIRRIPSEIPIGQYQEFAEINTDDVGCCQVVVKTLFRVPVIPSNHLIYLAL